MNLVFNGTSIALNRCNYFWRDYLKCMVASEDASRIYKSAGGAYDKYDQRPWVRQHCHLRRDYAGQRDQRTVQGPVRPRQQQVGRRRNRFQAPGPDLGARAHPAL